MNASERITERAPLLVHGATGFTGRLVCEALRRREVRFDVSGRDREKLEGLARDLDCGASVSVVDVASRASLDSVLAGRRVVAACAGPFIDVGEAFLAAAVRAGVIYVDTSGEQSFVGRALTYHTEARARGATVVPAMAYEIAIADWLVHIAIARLDREAPSVAVCYVQEQSNGGAFMSRGTLLSLLHEIGRTDALQFVDGLARRELPMTCRRRFNVVDAHGARKELVGLSIPGAEALIMPSHTDARTVRTYVAANGLSPMAALASRAPYVIPRVARLARAVVERARGSADATARGRSDANRGRFEVIIEAARGGVSALARARGVDPYSITAEIQAFAAVEALAGRVTANGVVAPSVAFDGARGRAMLEAHGITLEVTDRSREK